MVSNQDLIRAVFDGDTIEYNKLFFRADWKKAEIENLETEDSWLTIKNIIWYNGVWEDGIWENGHWYKGIWKKGLWKKGVWEDGIWENGIWRDGTWRDGTWEDGYWEEGTWKNGKIFDSKTKKYIESAVPPNECKWSSSYGK